MTPVTGPAAILRYYYAATIVFLLLDYGAHINVRVAFLEPYPRARLAYYGVCFACLALMLWRPAWSELLGTVESLVTIVALIFSMALGSMIVTDQMIETGQGFVTRQEIVNFLISGSAAWFAWNAGIRRLHGKFRG